ncbi:S-adenosyl-L-methionine-dependent methyltransferase [Guyanagaster necrorhizus]|uniref:S-adenosyl-L-methionine-dependent methyltransferase n=1 Tax=Guyanagaster necrorhizus TaxID=856835 RepID=A0A9P7W307_9AGAR|nr:S-adenosyl-L-methionine-dependent methyltransferase [Guyanagaster necrorhizus MCA 3950]KAG7452446.1 S-adenosyl-L-methionine-dependent methyltransferase [Guyanagaster necrorhizus MCA 3950]
MLRQPVPPTGEELTYVGDDDSEFFRHVHGRSLNTLNTSYLLPSDRDEVKRSEYHHRMLKFVFGGQNYVGPVREALQFGQQRRVLDLGTGGGLWAIEMADEFPRAEVIGIDLAPIQPRDVPPNCTFELCDLDQRSIPYPDGYFDLIHARSMFMGIHNYPRFLREVSRLLRPGGLVILIEPDLTPTIDPSSPAVSSQPDASGWFTFWETYHTCLRRQRIDPTVPQRMADLLVSTGMFENIVRREGNIPVGSWPREPVALTVGQLQWMDYELLLPALRPFFLTVGLPETTVRSLVADAQHDLYHPSVNLSCRINIVHASKRL